MKYILDTDTFNDSEYDTLVSTLKEQKDLYKIIEEVNNDECYELEMTITFNHKRVYGYWGSKPLHKPLLLKLLSEIEKVYKDDVERLKEVANLEEVK